MDEREKAWREWWSGDNYRGIVPPDIWSYIVQALRITYHAGWNAHKERVESERRQNPYVED